MRELERFYFLQGHNEKEPLITVAITCYNVAKFLSRCIESVMAQTYRNLEILLIDDGSRDNSGSICDYYETQDTRIKVVHQSNAGPGAARNLAIDMANGEYIAFVDGDDFVEPYMYEYLLQAMVKGDAKLGICRYFSDSVDEKPMLHPLSVEQNAGRVMVIDREELLTLYIEESEEYTIKNAVWNKLYHKTVLEKNRMPEQKYYEDILFTMRLLNSVETAVFIDTPLYHYIIDRKDSIMNQGACEGILTDQIPAYHARDEFLAGIGREDLVDTQDYLMYKKLLLLYTEARRDKTGKKKKLMGELADEIRTCEGRLERVYSCRIANPHEKMRMKLFLWHPWAYNLFMDINEGFILPLRQRKQNI